MLDPHPSDRHLAGGAPAVRQGVFEDTGYHDVVLVQGDGGLGYRAMSPYDRIAVTAACPKIPLRC
jgi:protein-L-isoaspartate O-methyltransferase